MSQISKKIIEILTETPGLKADQIRTKSGFKGSQISHALSYLKTKGTLKMADRKYSIASAPTTQTKPESSGYAVQRREIGRLISREQFLAKRVSEIQESFGQLHERHEELKTKYTNEVIGHLNSKAVIAYLEEKLAAK